MIYSLIRLQKQLGDRFGRLIAWSNMLIIGVLIYEVCVRYLFNAPTNWAHETSTMIFGGYCLAAGVYTQVHNKHVRIDIIHQLFSERVKAWLDCLSGLFIIAAFSILLVISFRYAMDSWLINEVSSKSPWRPLLYPIKSIIPLTVLLLTINQVIYFVRDLMIGIGIGDLEMLEYSKNSH